jgi:CubicO group peptidase (beta-lactamase class C family)
LKKYVFDPAGMKDSVDFVGGAIIERKAQDYLLDGDGYKNASLKDYSFLVGAGSVYGTAADVHRFGMAMLEGKYGETARTAWIREGIFSASGSTNGHRAYVEIKADKSYGFALTSNLGSGAVDIVQTAMKEILEGREPSVSSVTVPRFDLAANPDLGKFIGKYKAANGSDIEIVSRGGHLFSSDIKLYSVKPNCFFDYRFFGEACFIIDGERVKEVNWKGATFNLTWVRQ